SEHHGYGGPAWRLFVDELDHRARCDCDGRGLQRLREAEVDLCSSTSSGRNAETNSVQLQRSDQRQESGPEHPPANRRYAGGSVVVAMSIRRCLILVWMVAGLHILSMGQDQPPQNPPSENPGDSGDSGRTAPAAALSAIAGMGEEGGTGDASGDLPAIPALLGGQGISSAFTSELERSNYLRGGVNVSATYDDNPLLYSSGLESNTNETIFPNISIAESSSRMRWSLGYAGGLTVNQKITSENQGSHNLNFDSQFRLSPHVNLRVAENFSLTTGFFDAGDGAGVVGGAGGPNASLIAPLATQRSSMTTVETNYHFALNDLIGASGSFYDSHFTNGPTGTLLT